MEVIGMGIEREGWLVVQKKFDIASKGRRKVRQQITLPPEGEGEAESSFSHHKRARLENEKDRPGPRGLPSYLIT